MGRSRDMDEMKRDYLKRKAAELALEGRGSRWASGPRGTVSILAASEMRPDRWWFGLNEKEFHDRGALGMILLCKSSNELLDFGFAARRVLDLLPRLSADERGERKFNVVRKERRLTLQVPRDKAIDLTAARGDLSWLPDASGSRVAEVAHEGTRYASQDRVQPPEHVFFARVRGSLLEPLDPP